MANPPFPPPPPPGPVPPPPPYPGTGFSGYDTTDQVVYTYGSTPAGAVPRASYGRRAVAFLVDTVVLNAPVVGAFVFARVGPREVRACELTESGDIAVYGDEGTLSGLCEFPTGGSIAAIALLLLGAVVLWFAYYAHEGRTGRTLGKRLVGLRTLDRTSRQPIGAGRNIGRNLVRALLAFPLGVPAILDHLWPLWDRNGQTLHDKAVDAVVVPAEP